MNATLGSQFVQSRGQCRIVLRLELQKGSEALLKLKTCTVRSDLVFELDLIEANVLLQVLWKQIAGAVCEFIDTDVDWSVSWACGDASPGHQWINGDVTSCKTNANQAELYLYMYKECTQKTTCYQCSNHTPARGIFPSLSNTADAERFWTLFPQFSRLKLVTGMVFLCLSIGRHKVRTRVV